MSGRGCRLPCLQRQLFQLAADLFNRLQRCVCQNRSSQHRSQRGKQRKQTCRLQPGLVGVAKKRGPNPDMDREKGLAIPLERLHRVEHLGSSKHLPALIGNASVLNALEAVSLGSRLIHRLGIGAHDRDATGVRNADILHRGRVTHDRVHHIVQRLIVAQGVSDGSVQGLVPQVRRRIGAQASLHRLPRHQRDLAREHVIGSSCLLDALSQKLADKQEREHRNNRERQSGSRYHQLRLQPHA